MSIATESQLSKLLTLNSEEVDQNCEQLFEEATGDPDIPLVLFGAGFYGRKTLAGLRALGREPLGFVDNDPNLWGTEIDGLPVYSRLDAEHRFGSFAAFVVTIFNGSTVRGQLMESGRHPVVTAPMLYWKFPEQFLSFGGISRSKEILSVPDQVTKGYELWDDEWSRKVYLSQLEWRMTLDYSVLPRPTPAAATYFPEEVQKLANEIFVDCGAFDGDTVSAYFDRWARYPFATAVAVEPDRDNCKRMEQRLAQKGLTDRCRVHNLAVASAPGTQHFEFTGTAASTISQDGTGEIRCETLDNLLAGTQPTYLKMDIEGAELDALRGATKTISQHRPVLAICLYHKPRDLWEIPLYAQSVCNDYQFLLRAHAEECWELVLYAIPNERYDS